MHKSKPKISVIVTAHNYGRYLSECLDSIIRQTIDSCEIIIVDDGSTDNTDEMLRKYEEHIDKIIKLNGSGVAVASNEGIRNSPFKLFASETSQIAKRVQLGVDGVGAIVVGII